MFYREIVSEAKRLPLGQQLQLVEELIPRHAPDRDLARALQAQGHHPFQPVTRCAQTRRCLAH